MHVHLIAGVGELGSSYLEINFSDLTQSLNPNMVDCASLLAVTVIYTRLVSKTVTIFVQQIPSLKVTD
jgi:hypothetical protein